MKPGALAARPCAGGVGWTRPPRWPCPAWWLVLTHQDAPDRLLLHRAARGLPRGPGRHAAAGQHVVRFVGQRVAAVVADSEAAAEAGCEAVCGWSTRCCPPCSRPPPPWPRAPRCCTRRRRGCGTARATSCTGSRRKPGRWRRASPGRTWWSPCPCGTSRACSTRRWKPHGLHHPLGRGWPAGGAEQHAGAVPGAPGFGRPVRPAPGAGARAGGAGGRRVRRQAGDAGRGRVRPGHAPHRARRCGWS